MSRLPGYLRSRATAIVPKSVVSAEDPSSSITWERSVVRIAAIRTTGVPVVGTSANRYCLKVVSEVLSPSLLEVDPGAHNVRPPKRPSNVTSIEKKLCSTRSEQWIEKHCISRHVKRRFSAHQRRDTPCQLQWERNTLLFDRHSPTSPGTLGEHRPQKLSRLRSLSDASSLSGTWQKDGRKPWEHRPRRIYGAFQRLIGDLGSLFGTSASERSR